MKTIFINIIASLALIFTLDIVFAIILDKKSNYTNNQIQIIDEKALLPNYNGEEWPEIHFHEFSKLESKFNSFLGWRKLPYSGTTINIDKDGFRKSNFEENQSSGSSNQLVLLGGSVVWGYGSRDQETIASNINKLSEGKIKALNFGESGYIAYQSYLLLQEMLIENKISPSIVIALEGVNDNPLFRSNKFSHFREEQIALSLKGLDSKRRSNNVDKLLPGLRDLSTRINSFLFNNTSKTDLMGNKVIVKPISDLDAAEMVLSAWLRTLKLSKEFGFTYYCILQPNIYQGNPELGHLKDSYDQEIYYSYYDELKQLLKSDKYSILQGNFIDLTHIFDSIPNIYIDFCHISPEGNQIIAKKLIETLENKKIE